MFKYPAVSAPAPDFDPRVPLALERTFLAWIRTALALMGFGFVVARFGLFLRQIEAIRGVEIAAAHGTSRFLGIALIALGICVAAGSAFRFRYELKKFERRQSPGVRSAVLPTIIAFALSGIGVATVWYLVQTG